MKKIKNILIISIILTSLVILTGCSNNTKNPSYTNENINASIPIEQSKQIQPIIISTFTTKIYDKSEGRMNNLKKASNDLSGLIIKSNEDFSFNENMGPYSKERGYQKGKIFDADGDVMEGYGGGICQVSSTLYNAALQLGLEIQERNDHSNKVQYIELGKDAAVSYGNLDLKFKNTKDYDIKIECRVENDQLIIDLYRI